MSRRTAEPSAGGAGRTFWERWTTGRWLSVGVAVSLTVLLVLGLLAAWALNRASSTTGTMVNRSSPALIAAVRLESAVLDQETGIRGYGLSGQSSFLQPYTEGLAAQQAAVTELRGLLAGDASATADLDAVLVRVRTWQDGFAAPIAAAPPGAPVALAAQRSDQGRQEFDAIRTAAALQQSHLQQAGAASYRQLQTVQRQRDWIFAAIAVVLLLLAVLVVAGLRRGVTAPLERLSRDVREVGAGDFARAVTTSTGPADLRRLAKDVEGMRRRLADELAFSDQARARLDEQAEELRRSNGELEQFAYVASHDLQEPLRKVASFCQLLQRRYADKLDERADQYIGFAVDGANRMQTLINDLLAFSRVGRTHKEYVQVDLEQVFTDTVDALSIAVEESGAVITHDPLPVLTADATQIGMLFQNLIGNAIKFRSPDRSPEVHLSAEPDGDRWQFAVADNGIGIGNEFADRVFVIFQRLHTKEAYPGNGIGLAMCKKIVEFHGGSITVDPDRDSGARISFTLPLAPAVPVADPGEPERAGVVV
nr:sensor histidine kinase [Streptacidiphilus carbonis]